MKSREEELRDTATAALKALREIAPNSEAAGLTKDAELATLAARALARALDRYLTDTQPID